ncbi:MAG TPA: sensor domain-containing diguanylate cyclase [Candidatus Saccharimonadales bacterium]|nr:sensor domain-containing diguanylate cyclase [Candidatus Saccharimonadales bacterium]
MEPARRPAFATYSILMGLPAYAALAWLAARHPGVVAGGGVRIAVFTVLAALSWRFSFSIFPKTSISLDMAYILTALLVLPAPSASLIGAGTAILGSFLRSREEATFMGNFSVVMINSAILVAMTLAGQSLVGYAGVAVQPGEGLSPALILSLLTLFLLLNTVNLSLMTVSIGVRGEPLLPYVRHYGSIFLMELFYTVPLSAVMVLLYNRAGFPAFVLLGVTTLFASVLLKNLNLAQEELRRGNEELTHRAQQLQALNSISREITANLDLDGVFETIHTQCARLVDATSFVICLYNRERAEIHYAYVVRDGKRREARIEPLGRDAISWVIKSGKAVKLRDLLARQEDVPVELSEMDPGLRAVLAIPLVRLDNEVTGVLSVGSPRPDAYTARDQETLSAIGQTAAIAIENARYYEMATVDQLTKLYLKDYFHQRIDEELNRARRYGHAFSVLMMDIDSFKELNDAHGHLAGDRFLHRVGEVIKGNLRSHDIPCRYGGEEFAILLPETEPAEAIVIAERIRRTVGEIRIRENRRMVGTTISIGIASYPRSARRSASDLLRKADGALYQAKREGKDKVIAAA